MIVIIIIVVVVVFIIIANVFILFPITNILVIFLFVTC